MCVHMYVCAHMYVCVCMNIKASEDNIYGLSLLDGFEGFEVPDLIDMFVHSFMKYL